MNNNKVFSLGYYIVMKYNKYILLTYYLAIIC